MSETEGIIYPPPELRGIVDSTAKYVAKNGTEFENKIKRDHQGKPKFSFLFVGDPFNAYYRSKVREIKELQQLPQETPRDKPIETSKEDDGPADTQSLQHQVRDRAPQDNGNQEYEDSSQQGIPPDQNYNQDHGGQQPQSENHDNEPRVQSKLDEYIQEKTVKLVEPPALNFLANPSTPLTDMEIDVIKLTSQYIATHGRAFLLELVSREQTNSDFDFTKPQHGQFSYMNQLIHQYTQIRDHPPDIVEQLRSDATSQKNVLDKIRMRAEWNRMLQLEKRKQEEAEEREKLLYSQIDWQDFVVVETIDYGPEEVGEYPPTTADQVGTRMLLQQRYEEQHQTEEMEIDMDMDSDDEEAGTAAGALDNFAIPGVPADKVVIRKDYDPKSAPKAAIRPENLFVSPITNELITSDQIADHIRYNLADPKYLEKKEQMLQSRMNEEIVFPSGSQIQDSLKSLAERRTDIFGVNEEEAAIGRRIGEEEEGQTKDNRLIWDGHKSSLPNKKKKLN